jgi:predicted RNA binding protein YcfA (HicA-like mRNA interferase family)
VSRREKLKEKVLSGNQDKNFSINDLCTLLVHLGFSERRGKGSHRIFSREGVAEIIDLQPARDGKAKPYQVRQVREIIRAYSL